MTLTCECGPDTKMPTSWELCPHNNSLINSRVQKCIPPDVSPVFSNLAGRADALLITAIFLYQ